LRNYKKDLIIKSLDDNLKDLSFELADSDSEHDYFKVFYRGKDLTTDGKVTTDEITLSLHNQGYIDGIEIPVNLRNKGLGKSIYRKINSELLNGELKSDSLGRISEDAKRVWESLVKSGEAIKTTRGYKFKETQITPQQKQQALDVYTDYIARVSLGIIKNPSSGEYNYYSKVKDIVYHGTAKTFDNFIKQFENGIFVTKNKDYAKVYGSNIKSVIIDSKNLLNVYDIARPDKKDEDIDLFIDFQDFIDDNDHRGYSLKQLNDRDESLNNKVIALTNRPFLYEFYKEKGYDSLLGSDEYVVFEPEQIHILGSKQDIEGFKKFVEQPINKEIKKITTAEISDLIKQGEIVYLDENKKPCKNWTK
jgi:hypothetical protein